MEDNIVIKDGIEYLKEEFEYVEYKVIVDDKIKSRDAGELEYMLNHEGDDNWELVTVIGSNVILKRKVKQVDYSEI